MYGCNVLFRPLCMAVMSYSDPYVMSYSDPYVWLQCIFRPLCMAVMSHSDPYVWL